MEIGNTLDTDNRLQNEFPHVVLTSIYAVCSFGSLRSRGGLISELGQLLVFLSSNEVCDQIYQRVLVGGVVRKKDKIGRTAMPISHSQGRPPKHHIIQ